MQLKKILIIIFIYYFTLITPTLASNTKLTNDTILSSSIFWDDMTSRNERLLKVPTWENNSINAFFHAYSHPDIYGIPKLKEEWQQNALFINLFFGPLSNPFQTVARPAKAYIIINATDKTPMHFYMAPIVQNALDGNTYVFEHVTNTPLLLHDWVNQIKQAEKNEASLLFNICDGYGVNPNDSCEHTAYQNEVESINTFFSQQFPNTIKKLRAQKISAHRPALTDWQTFAKGIMLSHSDNIYSNSISWDNVNDRNQLLTTVTIWPNYQIIFDHFQKIRDLRYFSDEQQHDFSRRITWLYPDDGCWTRAAAMVRDFFGPINNDTATLARPSKLFAFGNLCVNTNNAPDGNVRWWYHTAPIVQDAETHINYVLDPSLNPNKPLTLDEWMAEVASNDNQCADEKHNVHSFNICNGYASSPGDNCNKADKENFIAEFSAIKEQAYFRSYERHRQIELKRDPNDVLGNNPPWQN